MKPSHRKDVIIARAIFAAMCVAIIAIITTVIVMVVNSGKGDESDKALASSETEDQKGSVYVVEPGTEHTVVEEVYAKTTDSVNLREKPEKTGKKIKVLPAGTKVQVLSEDNGWTEVLCDEQTGYISSEFLKIVDADEEDSEASTSTNEETASNTGYIVCIDPGHQGSGDSTKEPNGPNSSNMKARVLSGTSGTTTGVDEYELTLDISLQLKAELESRGYTVFMTRESHDVNISNKERAEFATSVSADISVRIHADGSDSSSANGASALYPSTSNPYVSNLSEDSKRLSTCVLNSYCDATGMKNRGLQANDTMTGINWSTVPVTIIEMGFMSNPTDDVNMEDDTYQTKMVQGIANGIDSYFGR